MAEETKEPWLNYLALTTVVFAVCATLATFKGGGFSTRSLLRQSQASDKWAHYQAKSVKGNLYEVQGDSLALALKGASGKMAEDLQAALADNARKVAKYDKEKAEIMQEAKALEAERDQAGRHGQIFGLAVIFLQIAILFSSIAALMKKKALWLAGLAAGVLGLVWFANGFFLFIR